jgi:hypothetical protein
VAIGNTTTGVVPTDATPGYPKIAFSSGVGYLQSVNGEPGSTDASFMLYDRLFHVGEISYAAGTTTLSSQPSYSSRIVNSSYAGLQIYLQVTTAFATGNNWSVIVTYTDQDGNTGHSTPTTGSLLANQLHLNRMLPIALASGDSGVQKIESIIVSNPATAMNAGAFSIVVARPLFAGPADLQHRGIESTGLPIVFSDSAIGVALFPRSTTATPLDLDFTIVSA